MLFVVVPVVFIVTADLVTPDQPIVLTVTEAGRRAARTFAMPDVHGATTAVSLAATATVFDAARWPTYAAANVLIAFTHALIGALPAPVFGRLGGVFIAFLRPFLDIGIVQSPMLNPDGFDESTPLLVGIAWLAALTLAVVLTYRYITGPAAVSTM